MTSKELAYSAQQHIQVSTGADFKRAHIYELLAAAFGFNSYAALSAEAVFTKEQQTTPQASSDGSLVRHRCIEIGYQSDVASATAVALSTHLVEHQIGVIKIADLVARLHAESAPQYGYLDDDEPSDQDDAFDSRWADPRDLMSDLLLEGLERAASKGNALAHYAIALLHAPDENDERQGPGSDYWYSQAQRGRVLTGVEKEWADAHATRLAYAEKYAHHLREAARLGHQDALLDLADRFDDPAFFEQADARVTADPALVAEIAERLGRPEDARKWLAAAAESGDTEAMRQLIENYDHGDLQRCWTWIYLAELVGTDLTRDEYRAINEDGSPYDDDVGGTLFAVGRDGVELDPVSAEQDAAARHAAWEVFKRIQRKGQEKPLPALPT